MNPACSSEASRPCAHDEHSNLQAQSLSTEDVVVHICSDSYNKKHGDVSPLLAGLALGLRDS